MDTLCIHPHFDIGLQARRFTESRATISKQTCWSLPEFLPCESASTSCTNCFDTFLLQILAVTLRFHLYLAVLHQVHWHARV
jgi:hypothetical protein